MEELGVIAQKVYTNNFGDSLEDVAEGLSVVQKTTGLVGDELQKATESGFALRDTFGYDLQESARAANALMKNFGVTAEEAYNIIAVGAQNGADQNGDLLDTLNDILHSIPHWDCQRISSLPDLLMVRKRVCFPSIKSVMRSRNLT